MADADTKKESLSSTAPSEGQERDEVSTATGVRGFVERHPQITAWVALSIVMVVLVVWSARDVQLLPTQLLSIVVATIGLAGLCVWIIGWD